MAENRQRRSALDGIYQTGVFGSGGGLALCERHPLNLLDVGGNVPDGAFGASLPREPNTVSAAGSRRVLWLGPARWLCVDTREISPPDSGAVNDVSSGRTVIRLTGPRVRDVLAKGCPLDLHPRAFGLDECAQSRLGGLNVLLDRVADDAFDLYVARGFAQSLWEFLTEAAEEYGYAVLERTGS